MGTFARKRGIAVLTAILATGVAAVAAAAPAIAHQNQPGWQQLAAGPAPASNPLTGFIPYAGSYTTFPYSMEWFYLPVNAVVKGPQQYQWSALEQQLSAIARRGHQAAFRFYLDYPGKPSGIPQYLLDGGLVTHAYDDYGNNGLSVSPDYEDAALDTALDQFIAAFGHRYDGDPRIGFIQLGLLGFWGEWHTYPYDGWAQPANWFASAAEQSRVLNAYTSAFTHTRLQTRYPSTDNASAPVGYHDDSFAVETLPGPGWHFMDKMAQAGATDKWLTQPVGGELRPEIQGCIFDVPADCPVIEGGADNDFPDSVSQTHASWLLNQYAFDPGYTGDNYARALAGAQSLGYQLQVTAVRSSVDQRHQTASISIQMRNNGVAPFSYDWPVQLAAADRAGHIVATWTTSWSLRSVTPGAAAQFSTQVSLRDVHGDPYRLLLRVANPLPGGVPLRFANADQDRTLAGWLTLGDTRLT